MTPNKKFSRSTYYIILIIVVPIILFGIFGAVAKHPYMKKEIALYSGPGDIKDISFRFLFFPVKGYNITFPYFYLSRQKSETYKLTGLPAKKQAGIYLVVEEKENYWDKDENKARLKAKVEFIIKDSKGKIVLHVNDYLKDMIWMTPPETGLAGRALYNMDTSFFNPKKNETYKLSMKFSPDENLDSLQGYVFIECGGSI